MTGVNRRLRRTLLMLNAKIAAGEEVELTDPTLLRETDEGEPAGVGVENMPTFVGAAVLPTRMLHEAGLRPEDVPYLTFKDYPTEETDDD